MSLINEALKKAQRQRTEGPAGVPPPVAAPISGDAPAGPIAKRRPPMPARTLVILLVGGGAVLVMGGVLAFLFLGDNSTVPPRPSAPVVAARPASPVSPAPAPESPIAPVPAPAPAPVIEVKLPAIPHTTPSPTPAPAPAPVPTPAPAVVHPEPAKPIPRVPTANPLVYEFLEKLRVAGIRASATDPKVIMNDRVFRLNDIVDRITQLRLVHIDNDTLTFVDGSGFEYKKSF